MTQSDNIVQGCTWHAALSSSVAATRIPVANVSLVAGIAIMTTEATRNLA